MGLAIITDRSDVDVKAKNDEHFRAHKDDYAFYDGFFNVLLSCVLSSVSAEVMRRRNSTQC
jgi:hypothetical protein